MDAPETISTALRTLVLGLAGLVAGFSAVILFVSNLRGKVQDVMLTVAFLLISGVIVFRMISPRPLAVQSVPIFVVGMIGLALAAYAFALKLWKND